MTAGAGLLAVGAISAGERELAKATGYQYKTGAPPEGLVGAAESFVRGTEKWFFDVSGGVLGRNPAPALNVPITINAAVSNEADEERLARKVAERIGTEVYSHQARGGAYA